MVRKVGQLFACEICALKYEEEGFAMKCEEWCSSHNSCNIAIARHALK